MEETPPSPPTMEDTPQVHPQWRHPRSTHNGGDTPGPPTMEEIPQVHPQWRRHPRSTHNGGDTPGPPTMEETPQVHPQWRRHPRSTHNVPVQILHERVLQELNVLPGVIVGSSHGNRCNTTPRQTGCTKDGRCPPGKMVASNNAHHT